MSKTIKTQMTYDAPCEEVFAMMIDPGYVEAKLTGTGGRNPQVEVSEAGSDTIVHAVRDLPAQVPSFVKSFTGESINVDETDRWSPADDLGARTCAVALEFAGTPSSVSGGLDLRPEGDGCVIDVTFEIKVSVPLVGGKIESVIGEQIERGINKENQIGRDWLAQG